jgi:YbbR domain-containing protein
MNTLAQFGRMLRDAGRSLVTNVPLALLSLALATALWVAVTNAENPSLRRVLPFTVDVKPLNVPASLTVTGTRPAKVRVTLVGPRDAVEGVQPGDLTALVDLSSTGAAGSQAAGDYDADVHVSVRQRNVQAESVDPAVVTVSLEATAKRTVPVKVVKIDAPPLGYELAGDPAAQPAQATITGSTQQVDAVSAVVASLKLTGLTVSGNQTLALDPQDSAGNSIGGLKVEPASVSVAVHVNQVLFTRQILVDPRIQGQPAAGYGIAGTKADPPTVTVIGPVDVLNRIATAPTEAVDVAGATSDVIRTVGLQLPSGASLADPKSSVVATISIQPQRGQGTLVLAPKVIGVGAGLVASPEQASVSVSFSGPGPSVVRVTPADVAVTLDLTGLGPGPHQVEPKVSLPQGLQTDSLSPDRVTVTLAPAPQR